MLSNITIAVNVCVIIYKWARLKIKTIMFSGLCLWSKLQIDKVVSLSKGTQPKVQFHRADSLVRIFVCSKKDAVHLSLVNLDWRQFN